MNTSGLIPKRNRLKIITLHSPFCFFNQKSSNKINLNSMQIHCNSNCNHSGDDSVHKRPQNDNALAESSEKFRIGLF